MNNGEPWLGNQSLIFLFIEINDCNFPCGGAGEWGELCKKKGLLLEECRPHTRHSLTITTLHRVTWRSLRQQELSWGKAGLMGSPSQPGSFPESQWIWVHLIWLLQAWLCFHALHGALSKQHTFDKLSIKQVLRGNTVLQLTSRTVAPGRPRNEWWAATCEAGYCSEESSLSSTVVWECHEDSLGHTGNLVGSFLLFPIYRCACSVVSYSLWPHGLYQAPLSVEFPRKQHWSGLPFATLGDLPDSEIEPAFPASPALAGRFFTTASPEKSQISLPYPVFSSKAPWGNWKRRQLQVYCSEKALGIYGPSLRKSEDKAFRGM